MLPSPSFDLTGRTALVTGGATGLGYHMARALTRSGATVMIAARRRSLLEESSEKLNAEFNTSRVIYQDVDLNQHASVAELSRLALSRMGHVDILVGNAGMVNAEQIGNLTEAVTDELIQVNLRSNIFLAQSLLPAMRERRWGRIVFSSSIGSNRAAPQEGNAVYAAAKSGLNAYTRGIAAEYGHFNITANAIILGFFKTAIVLGAEQHFRETEGDAAATAFMDAFGTMAALGRMGDPSEVEGLVQLLASDAGSYITGASIALDGGMGIMMRANPWTDAERQGS